MTIVKRFIYETRIWDAWDGKTLGTVGTLGTRLLDSTAFLVQNERYFEMNNLPKKISDLANVIKAAGGRAMLVGGCVRDRLMGVEPKDW
ncbi:MAG TPA: hypothetical protein VL325_04895, partial [Pyrinomonadaceae bacterium]|nr:hypothetical protein [Pyrinomonadaceae bacterium]